MNKDRFKDQITVISGGAVKAKPYIKYTVPYKDPIWAMIEITPNGRIKIKGKQSVFVGSSPAKLGVRMESYIYPIVPDISDRRLG